MLRLDDGESRTVNILDPMWLVNCSEKDIEKLYWNRILCEDEGMLQAQQYQRVIDVCYLYEIHSGRSWETEWRKYESIKDKEIADLHAKREEMRKNAAKARFRYGPGTRPLSKPKEPDEKLDFKTYRKWYQEEFLKKD